MLLLQSEVSSLVKVKVWMEKRGRSTETERSGMSTEHGTFHLGPLSAKKTLRNQRWSIPDREMWLVNGNEDSEGNQKLGTYVLVIMEFYKHLKHKLTNHN